MNYATLLLPVAASAALFSCATADKVGTGAVSLVHKTSAATASLSNRIRPPSVQVVEVREKDLKELPSGHERALAFSETKKRSFWSFGGPVDFKEPMLPTAGGEMDGSLLPPKDL